MFQLVAVKKYKQIKLDSHINNRVHSRTVQQDLREMYFIDLNLNRSRGNCLHRVILSLCSLCRFFLRLEAEFQNLFLSVCRFSLFLLTCVSWSSDKLDKAWRVRTDNGNSPSFSEKSTELLLY